jgi:metal-responsive CopG/Arc/MetJ family transcriptional regulator
VLQEQMNKDLTYRLDRMTMQISVSLKPDLVKRIDEAAGVQSRSSFITRCIYEHFEPSTSEWEADKKSLTEQLESLKVQQRLLEDQVAFLKDQNTRLLDAVSQKLLTEATPKKHWWQRRKKE